SASGNIFVNNPTGSFNIVGLFATGQLQIDALTDLIVSTNNVSVNAVTILNAVNGNLSINDITFSTGINNFTATAKQNLSIENVTLTAGTTALRTTTGNLTITDVIATLASAAFNSGNNISISNTNTTNDFTVTGTFDAIAANDISISNVATTAGTTTLTATTAIDGDITISGGSFNTGTNAFTATAKQNLSIENATLTSGTTTLGTTTGNLTVTDVIATLASADFNSGNNISISNTGTAKNFNVIGTFNAIAANDISISNVATTAGTTALTATDGDITISGGTATFTGTLTATANNNLSFTDSALTVKDKAILEATNRNVSWTTVNATIKDLLQITAGTNITLTDIIVSAKTATLNAKAGNAALTTVIAMVTNNSQLTAANDLTIVDSALTAGSDTILNATVGNLTAVGLVLKTGTFAHATAGTDITLTDGSIDVKGQTADGHGNALELQAGNDIMLGGAITVADKNVRITAANGAVIDKNDTVAGGIVTQIDNLTAANSHIVLSAKNGIGSTDVLEFVSAKLINANVTGTGNIVLDIMSDTILQNVTTTNGNVDIHSGGSLTIAADGNITAAGTDKKIIFGAEKNLYFGKKSSLKAEKDIMIIASGGDIVSLAVNDDEAVSFSVNDVTESVLRGIYLVAGNDLTGHSEVYDNALIDNKADDFGKFIGSFKGKVDVIAGGSISVHNINNSAFLLGNVITGKDMLLTTVSDEMGIERIVAKQIDFVSSNIGIKQLADAVHIYLDKFTTSEYNTANKQLLTTEITVKLVGEIFLSVNKEDATLNLDEQFISNDNIFVIKVDNLVIDYLIAGKDCGLSQIGFAAETKGGTDYKEIANTTTVKQIFSDGDFTMPKLYSDDVFIHSDGITGNLNILDGQFGNTVANARLEISQIETEIDAINKSKTTPYDFWVWSLDGSYSITSSHDGISYQDELLRALRRTQMYLELNGNASYTDTAFGLNINDWTHRIESRINNINVSNGSGIINGLELPLPFNRENQKNQEMMNNLLKEIEDIWSFNWTDNNRNTERWIVSSLEDALDFDITDKE
ncbi:MAG: hypothetical protein LBU34_08370, partial [Planctomycetaceae bacterium]|nr:hypothetical protein [Planctomycetaceae bacterium]